MQKEIIEKNLASQGCTETFQDRFWDKVIIVPYDKGCWIWTGGTNEHGYGVIGIGSRGFGLMKSHRASWIIHNGLIPEGIDVLHKCDNPPCCNPDHLFLGTHQENMSDAVKKRRMRHGENHSRAKLTEDQVLEIRSIYKKYAKNQKEIALKFGISIITVRHICYRRGWKHLH